MTYGVSYKYGYKIKNKDIFKILYFSIYKNIFQIARNHKFLLRYHCISNLLYFNVIQLHDKTFFPKGACLLLVFNALLIAIFFFSFFFFFFSILFVHMTTRQVSHECLKNVCNVILPRSHDNPAAN